MKQKIKISKLRNGSLLISEEMPHLNSSIMGIYVKIGSDYEPMKLNGISHLVEHMLFKGTNKRDAKSISKEIESLGGIFNAYTSRDHTCYYFKALPNVLNEIYDVFEDIVFNSIIPQEELIKEKMVILEELKSALDDPQDIIFQNLNSMIFKNTQYEKTILGSEKSIKRIERKDVLSFLSDYYTNGNVFFAYAGPQKHEEIKLLIDLKRKNNKCKQIKRLKKIRVNEGIKNHIYKSSLVQMHVAMGIKTVQYVSEDRYPLLLLMSILGTGMSSRLFIKLREDKGYVYNVFSFLESFLDSGMMGIYFACDKKNYYNVLSIIDKEFKDLRKGNIEKQEFEKVKKQIISSSLISFDSMNGRIGVLARSIIYRNKVIYLDEIINKINKIKIEDIVEIAKQYLHIEKFNISAINNNKKFKL